MRVAILQAPRKRGTTNPPDVPVEGSMSRSLCLALLLALVPADPLFAQTVRFELGQRLRLFERELAKPGRLARRNEAIDPLLQATPAFFAGQFAEAAGLLDRARLRLACDGKPSEAAIWANSLIVKPE